MTHILAKDPSSTQDWWAKQRHHLYGYPSGTMHLQQLSKVLHWPKELPLAPLKQKISAVKHFLLTDSQKKKKAFILTLLYELLPVLKAELI